MILGNASVASKNIFPRNQDHYHMMTMRDVSNCFLPYPACKLVSRAGCHPGLSARRLKEVIAVAWTRKDFACVFSLAEAEG